MLMIAVLTAIFEIISYLVSYMIFTTNVEIMQFIRILLIEVIYNVILTVIIYPLLQKLGYYIENEYTGNRILTKYF